MLNFGHTAGHALESYFNFQISHGIGVLYGMKVATKISLELNTINKKQYSRITNLIDSFNIILKAMTASDKLISKEGTANSICSERFCLRDTPVFIFHLCHQNKLLEISRTILSKKEDTT